MMKNLVGASVLVAGLLVSSEAAAELMDGNYLLQACESEDPGFAGFCTGFLLGTKTTWEYHAMDTGTCYFQFPDKTPTRQAVDVVVKYLKDNPGKRNIPAIGIVLNAYREAWPCKK